jgi:DNA-binding CsgD family transcriptional regulator
MNAAANTTLLTKNRVSETTEDEHLGLYSYLEVVKAFSKLAYQSVYVIDYAQMKFEYVSPNPLFLCGYSAEEVQEMGYDFYFKTVNETDLKLLDLVNETGFDFFERVPIHEKKLYSITYDFHLIDKNGKAVLINHKLTPLFLSKSGKMWKAMCMVSISHNRAAGNVAIYKQGSDEFWLLDITSRVWQSSSKPKLTARELEVLRLYAQGLTITQIAEKIFVSPDTIKYYRRQIFKNFNVTNIVEALSYAVNNKLI